MSVVPAGREQGQDQCPRAKQEREREWLAQNVGFSTSGAKRARGTEFESDATKFFSSLPMFAPSKRACDDEQGGANDEQRLHCFRSRLIDGVGNIGKKLQAHMASSSCAVLQEPAMTPLALRLKPFQSVGVNWLHVLANNKCNGILADDMGLGKTVQTLCFLANLAEADMADAVEHPFLIVVPTSLVDNWRLEIEKWTPRLDLHVYKGDGRERRQQFKCMRKGKLHFHIMLASYASLCASAADLAMLLSKDWGYLVLDEAHHIKDVRSARTRRLARVQARHKLLLTGTPVQNSIGELLALLSFLNPQLFRFDATALEAFDTTNCASDTAGAVPIATTSTGSQSHIALFEEFKTQVLARAEHERERARERTKNESHLLTIGHDISACDTTEDDSAGAHEQPQQLTLDDNAIHGYARKLLAPFVLRRTKLEAVQDLLPKVVDAVRCPMPVTHREMYDGIVAQFCREAEPGTDATHTSRSVMHNGMMQLRKAANHPLLFRREFTDERVQCIAAIAVASTLAEAGVCTMLNSPPEQAYAANEKSLSKSKSKAKTTAKAKAGAKAKATLDTTSDTGMVPCACTRLAVLRHGLRVRLSMASIVTAEQGERRVGSKKTKKTKSKTRQHGKRSGAAPRNDYVHGTIQGWRETATASEAIGHRQTQIQVAVDNDSTDLAGALVWCDASDFPCADVTFVDMRDFIGCHVLRSFAAAGEVECDHSGDEEDSESDGDIDVIATVTAYFAPEEAGEAPLLRITHPDGDEEDLDTNELSDAMRGYRTMHLADARRFSAGTVASKHAITQGSPCLGGREASWRNLLQRLAGKSVVSELLCGAASEEIVASAQSIAADKLSSMHDLELHRLCARPVLQRSAVAPPAVIADIFTATSSPNGNSAGGRMLSDLQLDLSSIVFCAAKAKMLQSKLPELKREGHRVLIFSQFRMQLDVLEELLRALDLRFVRLDGETTPEMRQSVLDQFAADNDIFAFLLTTKAGGVGLNITSADIVIIHDPDFNPQNDAQAEDRAHRIGQTKQVRVLRLVTEGTVEDGQMMQIVQRKRAVEHAVMGSAQHASAVETPENGASTGGTVPATANRDSLLNYSKRTAATLLSRIDAVAAADDEEV